MSQRLYVPYGSGALSALCPNPNPLEQYATMHAATEELHVRDKSDGTRRQITSDERARLSIDLLCERLGWSSRRVKDEHGDYAVGSSGIEVMMLETDSARILGERIGKMNISTASWFSGFDRQIRSRPAAFPRFASSPTTSPVRTEAAPARTTGVLVRYPWWNPRL